MDSQLRWICDLAEHAGMKYWIDSGTLLGLIRDKKLISHDRDLDISTWQGNAPQLKYVLSELRHNGYAIQTFSYNGITYKYHCVPPRPGAARKVDITLFWRTSGFAWYPEEVIPPNRYKQYTPFYCASGLVRRLAKFCAESGRLPSVVRSGIKQRLFVTWTWWIPLRFFEQLSKSEEFNVPIPSPVEDYLSFRYGEWKTPVQRWSYRTQDGGYQRLHPQTLLAQREIG